MLPSADAAEIPGRCGVDLVIIDLEHAGKDWSTVQNMVRAVEVSGASALVRVSGRDDAEILRVLETGASGIVVPFVETPEDARRVAQLVRYPPLGSRGACRFTRAAGYGTRRDEFAAIAREANESMIILAQIETVKGVQNFRELLTVEGGFDGYVVGRGDLAADMGFPGQLDHANVLEAVSDLVALAAAEGAPVLGIVAYSVDEMEYWRGRGIELIIYSVDTAILSDAYLAAFGSFGRPTEQ